MFKCPWPKNASVLKDLQQNVDDAKTSCLGFKFQSCICHVMCCRAICYNMLPCVAMLLWPPKVHFKPLKIDVLKVCILVKSVFHLCNVH